MISIARKNRNRVAIVNVSTAVRQYSAMAPKDLREKLRIVNSKLEKLERIEARGRELTDDQKSIKNRLTKQFDALETAIKNKKREMKNSREKTATMKNRRQRASMLNKHLKGFKNARTDQTPKIERDPLTGARIKDGFRDDPKRGFENSETFFRAIVHQAKSGADQILDPRLRILAADGTEFRNAAGTADGQTTLSDPYGGFLIPSTFLQGLITTETEGDPFTGTQKIPMNTPAIKINARVDKDHRTTVSGGLKVTRRAEASARDATKQEYEQIEMNCSGLFGLSTATEEMLTDSPYSVAAMIQAGFNEEFFAKLADEKLNGTGIGGEYEGILNTNHPATIGVTRTTSNRIKGLDVINMRTRAWKYQNCVWIANPDAYPDLIQACVESPNNAGIIMVMKGSWNSPTDPEILLGRPIIFTEFAPTFTAAGGLCLVNWSQYLEGNYVSPQFAESIHVRFETAERVFRFYARNAGRSWWRDKLTPKKGTLTLSPFVKLNA